jgi:hypothetical protein
VVLARRTGRTWFVAGLNGTDEPLALRLPLAAFRRYRHRFLIDEGDDPLMQLRASPIAAAETWEHVLPPRGGFVLRLERLASAGAETAQ